MFIGGSAGSTAGGIKVSRLMVLFKVAYQEVYRVFRPQARMSVKIGGSAVGEDIVTASTSVAACLGNVGPGLARHPGAVCAGFLEEMNRTMKWVWLGCLLFLGVGQPLAQEEEPEIVRFVQRGEALVAQGKPDLALVEYEKALTAGAGSALFLNRLGSLYLEVRRFDAALPIFQRSLREKPGQLPVYSKLGETFLALGKLDSALYYVEQARLLAPQASPIHSSLAFLYLQGGDLGRARAHLDTALHLDPENPEAHRYLGFLFTQVDSLPQAIAHYQRIIELIPDHFEAYNNIAFLYAQQGQYSQALQYYAQAKERITEPALVYRINERMEAVRALMNGKMRARYILVKTRAEAVDLRQRLQEGEDFAELARLFSLGPNAQDGGDLDFFGPGELLPALEESVMQLQVGEVSQVVEVPMGYLLIQRLN